MSRVVKADSRAAWVVRPIYRSLSRYLVLHPPSSEAQEICVRFAGPIALLAGLRRHRCRLGLHGARGCCGRVGGTVRKGTFISKEIGLEAVSLCSGAMFLARLVGGGMAAVAL